MYTHQVVWTEWNKTLKMFVEKSFKTTQGMVKVHIRALEKAAIEKPRRQIKDIYSVSL